MESRKLTSIVASPGGPKPRRNIVAGEPVKWRVIVLGALLRPWFARGMFQGMGVLGTVGRKTSKLRRHSVRAIREGAKVYIVSIPGPHALWVWNIRANPRVQVELGGAGIEGTAHELAEGPEREEARAVFVGTVNRVDYIECFIHWRGMPARWKIQRLHEMWFDGGIPVRIDLDS